MTEPIRVHGLRELSRDLKRLDADLPKALRVALNGAADLVVGRVRPQIPKRTGRAAGSLRAGSTRTAARVRAGGARARYYPWLDFGGARRGRGGGIARRPFLKDGRYIYEGYFRLKASGEFQTALESALLDVCRQAGVEVD